MILFVLDGKGTFQENCINLIEERTKNKREQMMSSQELVCLSGEDLAKWAFINIGTLLITKKR